MALFELFKYQANLLTNVHLVRFGKCGVRRSHVSWVRAGSGFTLLFKVMSVTFVKAMPAIDANYVGEHDAHLWHALRHYVGKILERVDFSNISRFGVDLTASKSGHKYMSMSVDLEDRKVLSTNVGRVASTLSRIKHAVSAHGVYPKRFEDACSDMFQAVIAGIRKYFLELQIACGKFHIINIIHGFVDDVRYAEQQDLSELSRRHHVSLKNSENLKASQVESLYEFSTIKLNLKTSCGYHLEINFPELFTQSVEKSEGSLMIFWVTLSGLELMKRVSVKIIQHLNGILCCFTPRISNGFLEELKSLLQIAKSNDRDCRSTQNLIAMNCLVGGRRGNNLPYLL